MTASILQNRKFSFRVGMLQTDPQLVQFNPRITGENAIFATTLGPQEGFTVAKIESASSQGIPATQPNAGLLPPLSRAGMIQELTRIASR